MKDKIYEKYNKLFRKELERKGGIDMAKREIWWYCNGKGRRISKSWAYRTKSVGCAHPMKYQGQIGECECRCHKKMKEAEK